MLHAKVISKKKKIQKTICNKSNSEERNNCLFPGVQYFRSNATTFKNYRNVANIGKNLIILNGSNRLSTFTVRFITRNVYNQCKYPLTYGIIENMQIEQLAELEVNYS